MTATGIIRRNLSFPWQLSAAFQRAVEADQDRWFLWTPVVFGAGIALYFALPVEPSLRVLALATLAAGLLAVLWRETVAAVLVTGALLALALGALAAKVRTERVAAPVIEAHVRVAVVTGWVELVEPRPERGQRVTLRVAGIEGRDAGATPERVRIRLAAADPALRPGDPVRISTALSPPAAPALPGGFDFARSAWFQGLGGVGFARAPADRIAIDQPMPLDLAWRVPVERLRQAIGQRITAALPGEAGAIANALVTGERGGISDATNDAYRDSGLLHILSISGLHMAIMAGAAFLAVRFLLTLSPAIALSFPIKKWAAGAAALAAFGYLLISGASYPTVRSYIMISIMFLAVLLDRPAVALRNVALAAIAILVLYPESLIDPGFQMSFAAVTALVSAYELIRERELRQAGERGRGPGIPRRLVHLIGGILLSTLIASLAVAPVAAYHFHKSQQYAMLANLLAVPICNLLIMPAALLTILVMPLRLEVFPLAAMGLGIEAMTWCAYKVAALPGAVGRVPEIPSFAFGLMVAGGLWLTLWRGRWRLAGVIVVLAGLAVAPLRWVPDLYIGRDGLVAVRGADGRLSALSPRGPSFDLARILEHDGDGRRLTEVAAGKGFRCDWSGCAVRAGPARIAIAGHAAALADDCASADVIVALDPSLDRIAASCSPSQLVTAAMLAAKGAHAIRFERAQDAGHLRAVVVSVADLRGNRPWARTPAGGIVPANLWQGAALAVARRNEQAPGGETSSSPSSPASRNETRKDARPGPRGPLTDRRTAVDDDP